MGLVAAAVIVGAGIATASLRGVRTVGSGMFSLGKLHTNISRNAIDPLNAPAQGGSGAPPEGLYQTPDRAVQSLGRAQRCPTAPQTVRPRCLPAGSGRQSGCGGVAHGAPHVMGPHVMGPHVMGCHV